MLPAMRLFSAVKEKFRHVGERVEASLDKVGPKYGTALAFAGILAMFAGLFVTGGASAATPNPNAIYGGLSIIDIALLVLGFIGFVAALILREFRVMIISVVLLALAAGAYYMGL